MPVRTNQQLAVHVSKVTIVWNLVLSAIKFFAGIFAHSTAMLSDAVHSASDVASTVIVIIGVKVSGKAADKEHPYGHERMECVAALLLAMMLFLTGAGIGFTSLKSILQSGKNPLPAPGGLALAAAALSVAVKETMYWYTKAAAKKIDSGALMADAWHHRSDALSSIGSFLGILGARLGFPVLDPLAGLVICIFILKVSISIFTDSVDKMVDKACDGTTAQALANTVLAQEGVLGIDKLNTRMFGNRIYVDVEIRTDAKAPLRQSHQIAQQVHDAIEQTFPKVKHCMVHVNPSDDL